MLIRCVCLHLSKRLEGNIYICVCTYTSTSLLDRTGAIQITFLRKTRSRSAGDLDPICVLFCIHFWTTFGSLWDPLVDRAACSDLVMPVLRCIWAFDISLGAIPAQTYIIDCAQPTG